MDSESPVVNLLFWYMEEHKFTINNLNAVYSHNEFKTKYIEVSFWRFSGNQIFMYIYNASLHHLLLLSVICFSGFTPWALPCSLNWGILNQIWSVCVFFELFIVLQLATYLSLSLTHTHQMYEVLPPFRLSSPILLLILH